MMFDTCTILVALVLGCVHARLTFMELNGTAPAHLSNLMNNQHIVMVGDSVTRYQYLSLVYLIHTHTFFPADALPNMLVQKTCSSWIEFYDFTNGLLSPNEYCDCFRAEKHDHIAEVTYENRYYYNKERNISVSYIQYFGDKELLHGHWQPSDAETNHQFHKPDHEYVTPRWKHSSIVDSLTLIAAKLQPMPSVLLLNAGHWRNSWSNTAFRSSVLDTALPLFERVIWKTTNYQKGGVMGSTAADQACTYPGVECMSLAWTQYLSLADYDDNLHYQSDIYNDINMQFIHQLITKEPLVVSPMKKEYIGHVVVAKGKQYIVDNKGVLRQFDDPEDTHGSLNCLYKINKRTHVHVLATTLVKHLLGEKIVDICSFTETV